MLNTNAGLWPQMAANSADAETVDPWGLGTVIETQARLWNHLLDANRSFWEFYAPWFTAGPSLWNTALVPLAQQDTLKEPEQSVDGVPDALETQARSWNHFLDANRSFWTAFNWQVPTAPWINGAAVVGTASNDAPPQPVRKPRAAAKKTAKRPRSA